MKVNTIKKVLVNFNNCFCTSLNVSIRFEHLSEYLPLNSPSEKNRLFTHRRQRSDDSDWEMGDCGAFEVFEESSSNL